MPPDAIAEALTKAGLARVESLAFEGRFATRLYYEVDPSWQGELPRTQLIGRDGGSEAWIGTADFPRIRAWLNREIRVGSPS